MILPKSVFSVAITLIMIGLATAVLATPANDAFNEGERLLKQEKYSEAILFYNKAIKLNPKYAEAYFYRGSAYSHLGQSDKLIDDCSKAIELNPKYAEAYSIRGVAVLFLGRSQMALEDCSKAIEMDPKYADAYENRANAYQKLGKHDLAAKDREMAKKL